MNIESLLDRPIAFQRSFVTLGVGITGALMLSQAVYWSRRTRDENGWFYKTQQEWEAETGLTRSEQETARKKLVRIGVISEMKKGIPCKLFYRVEFQKIIEALSAQASEHESLMQVCRNAANSDEGFPQSITETTTETTTEEHMSGSFEPDQSPPAQSEKIPHEKIRELYNKILGDHLPKCLGLNDKHRKGIKACYNLKLDGKYPAREGGIDFWEGLFNDVLDCPFMLGQNDRGWRADLAFLTTATKVQAFFEGKYDR